jgi:hypothetical protein
MPHGPSNFQSTIRTEKEMRELISRLGIPASNRETVLRKAQDGSACAPCITDEVPITIDADGSPVTLEPADWFVCFVPGLAKRWWHPLVNAKHKHVFAMRMIDENTWIIIEPRWSRLMVSVLSFDQAFQYLRWAAVGSIVKVREEIPGHGSQTRGWSNCAVLVAFMLGRSYRTWTPHGLYKRLMAEDGAQVVDMSQFLVEHFKAVAVKVTWGLMSAPPVQGAEPLESALLRMGKGIVSAMLSPGAISFHEIAACGTRLFENAADAYRANGPDRAIGRIHEILEKATRRGEFRAVTNAPTARQFVSMLWSNLHLATGFRIGTVPPPSESAIHYYVKSVVTAFLENASNVTRHDGSEPARSPRERADKAFAGGQPMSTVAIRENTEIDYKDWNDGPAGAFSHGAGLPATIKVQHLPASRSISIGASGI